MFRATVWDAVEYTPEANGEAEIRVRSVLDDASRQIEGIAPRCVPPTAVLTEALTSTGDVVRVGPAPYSGPLNYRALLTSIRNFAETGVVRVDTEDIAYSYRDDDLQTFNALQRGYGRTTGAYTVAASHLVGAVVTDVGYEYAHFNTVLRLFDYLWKTKGHTTQFNNSALRASANYNPYSEVRRIVRDGMGAYALGRQPVPIVRG